MWFWVLLAAGQRSQKGIGSVPSLLQIAEELQSLLRKTRRIAPAGAVAENAGEKKRKKNWGIF